MQVYEQEKWLKGKRQRVKGEVKKGEESGKTCEWDNVKQDSTWNGLTMRFNAAKFKVAF